jgi:hypothetical protein
MTERPRPRTVQELLGLVDRGWREFRAALRDPLLTAHAAAWEALVPGLLEAERRGQLGPSTDADVDKFNARVAERSASLDLATATRQLEAAHLGVVTAVGRLLDDDLRRERVVGIVASNTYGHYAEHAADLARQVPAR